MPLFDGMFERRCLATSDPHDFNFVTVTFTILFIVSNIPGNLLVILAVAIDPHKNLRVPFNYLMTNLAVADLVVGTVTGTIAVNNHLRGGLEESLSLTQIRMFDLSYFISCTASVLSLTALAIERYHAVSNPHSYHSKFSGKRVLLSITIIWFISLTLPFVYFEVGFIIYAFIFANTAIVAAVGITCFTYTLTLYKFKRHNRSIRESTCTSSTSSSTFVSTDNLYAIYTPVTCSGRLDRHTVLREQRITKMFLVVMIALLCCYGPSTIFTYTMSFCESCSCATMRWFRDLEFLFVILNSSVNFFCYALRSPRFRDAFASILRIKTRNQRARASVTNAVVLAACQQGMLRNNRPQYRLNSNNQATMC